MTDPKPKTRSAAVSLLVAGCLGMQILAGSRLLCAPRSVQALELPRVACAPRLWPFLDYPMFSEAYRAGDAIARDSAVVALEGGGEVRLLPGPDPAGLAAGDVVEALRAGRCEDARRLASASEPVRGRTLVGLRLERETLVLGRSGFASAGTELVRRTGPGGPQRLEGWPK